MTKYRSRVKHLEHLPNKEKEGIILKRIYTIVFSKEIEGSNLSDVLDRFLKDSVVPKEDNSKDYWWNELNSAERIEYFEKLYRIRPISHYELKDLTRFADKVVASDPSKYNDFFNFLNDPNNLNKLKTTMNAWLIKHSSNSDLEEVNQAIKIYITSLEDIGGKLKLTPNKKILDDAATYLKNKLEGNTSSLIKYWIVFLVLLITIAIITIVGTYIIQMINKRDPDHKYQKKKSECGN